MLEEKIAHHVKVVLVYKFPFLHFCTQLLTRKSRARSFYALLLAFKTDCEKNSKNLICTPLIEFTFFGLLTYRDHVDRVI